MGGFQPQNGYCSRASGSSCHGALVDTANGKISGQLVGRNSYVSSLAQAMATTHGDSPWGSSGASNYTPPSKQARYIHHCRPARTTEEARLGRNSTTCPRNPLFNQLSMRSHHGVRILTLGVVQEFSLHGPCFYKHGSMGMATVSETKIFYPP